MPTATAVLSITSSFPHMATTGGRTTRRRSRGDTFIDDDVLRDKDMPATKRRREEKAPMTTSGIGNGRTGNVTIAQPKKAKTGNKAVAYDEEDDGFVFTRKPRSTATRTAKRAPAPSLPPPPPSPPLGDSTPPAMLITPTRGSKARGAKTKRAVEKQPLELQRPPSLEPIPKQPLHKQPVPRQPLRQSNHQQDENSQNHHYYPNHQDVRHANVPKVLGYEQSMEDAGLRPITPPRPSPVLRRNNRSNKEAIEKVVIPLSDTPIIQRNKQFRNGSGGGSSSRRSSLGLRGRRASSLIDNGQVADPHSQLPSEDFYKHIDAELVEPRRMKQLLIWCAKRASMPPPLHNKMGGDGNANAIARIIEEEIMKDLLEKAELSNWFKRDNQSKSTIVKKLNPRNVDNHAKVKECEETLQRLKHEQRTWDSLHRLPTHGGALPVPPSLPTPPIPESLRVKLSLPLLASPSAPSASGEMQPAHGTLAQDPSANAQPPAPDQGSTTSLQEKPGNLSLSPPDLPHFLPPLHSLTSSLSAIFNDTTSNLEEHIDVLDTSLHQLSQLRLHAERVAGEALGRVEGWLDKREEKVKREGGTEGVGMREVLRGLSRVVG